MKPTIIIQARTGFTRLPNKMTKPFLMGKAYWTYYWIGSIPKEITLPFLITISPSCRVAF